MNEVTQKLLFAMAFPTYNTNICLHPSWKLPAWYKDDGMMMAQQEVLNVKLKLYIIHMT